MTVKLFHVACSCAPLEKCPRLRCSFRPTTRRESAFFSNGHACVYENNQMTTGQFVTANDHSTEWGEVKSGRIEWHTEMSKKQKNKIYAYREMPSINTAVYYYELTSTVFIVLLAVFNWLVWFGYTFLLSCSKNMIISVLLADFYSAPFYGTY